MIKYFRHHSYEFSHQLNTLNQKNIKWEQNKNLFRHCKKGVISIPLKFRCNLRREYGRTIDDDGCFHSLVDFFPGSDKSCHIHGGFWSKEALEELERECACACVDEREREKVSERDREKEKMSERDRDREIDRERERERKKK